MKRKVTLVLGKFGRHPLDAADCVYRQVEIDVPVSLENKNLNPVAIAVENQSEAPNGSKSPFLGIEPVINGNQIDDLVGKLLTYVDATYTDKEQREAHKDLVRQSVWDWFKRHTSNAGKTIEFGIAERLDK